LKRYGDRVAEEKLDKNPPIATTMHVADDLAGKGFRETYPLDSCETITIHKVEVYLDIASTPGRHGPPVVSKALSPVIGCMLEFHVGGTTAIRLYITGDTLVYDALKGIPQWYPDIDIAVLHLGGTKILGLLVTMDAKQGIEAVELFDAETSIPIHYDDYTVFKSSLEEFKQAMRKAGLEDRVKYVDRGDTADLKSQKAGCSNKKWIRAERRPVYVS
jgi:L-ascorbate metabolism protein UlaG (beta-lactamase superfamily)